MFADSNHRQFQRGLDTAQLRSTRQNNSLSLRRKQREQCLQKKRRQFSLSNNSNPTTTIKAERKYVNDYVASIKNVNNDRLQQLRGIEALLQLLCDQNAPPYDIIFNTGILPTIIQFMMSDDAEIHQLKLKSAWIITNMCASDNPFYTKKIVEYGAIKGFVNLLRNNPTNEIIEQTLWGISNIAGDSVHFRNSVFKTGILSHIADNFKEWTFNIQKQALWLIGNLCRICNKYYTYKEQITLTSCTVPLLSYLLSHEYQQITNGLDDEMLSDVTWCLSCLANNDNELTLEKIMESPNIIPAMVFALKKEYSKYETCVHQETTRRNNNKHQNSNETQSLHKTALLAMNSSVTTTLFRFFGGILCGSDEQTQSVLDNGFVDILLPFLTHFVSNIRRETSWLLSNILAGSSDQIEYVLSREDILNRIISSMSDDPAFAVQKEAAWCIANAISGGTTGQIKKLVDHGAIKAFSKMLQNSAIANNEQDVRVIVEALDICLSIYPTSEYNPYTIAFEECGGVDHLDGIIADHNISETIYNIIFALKVKFGYEQEPFVNSADEENKLFETNVDQKTNQFSFGNTKSNQTNSFEF